MNPQDLFFEFCDAHGLTKDTPFEAWAFGGAPDALAALVVTGRKTSTASAYAFYELEPEEHLPTAGDYSVVLDGADEPVCVIETIRTEVVPFRDVTAGHAFREGEGDRSLAYWRHVHEDFFRGEFAGTTLAFTPDMEVLTEEFRTVYSRYEICDLTEEQARDICTWQYQGEYSVYNFPPYEQCAEKGWVIADPARRKGQYFAVLLDGSFLGFFHIMDRGDHIDIGLGMHPDFCGRHHGRMFMELILATVAERHPRIPVQLSVLSWNRRAITCYESAGFAIVEKTRSFGMVGEQDAYRMVLKEKE